VESEGVTLALLDWRREVARLYANVRASSDPAAAWREWRSGRDRLFAEHPDSPLTPAARASFTGLPFADYDPELRFAVRLEPADPERLEVATGSDGTVPFERIGGVTLGSLVSLDVWWLASYGGGVFLPLRDGSAGDTSYGGGRYLLDTVKGADLGSTDDGRIVVDLNFLYAPSCAHDETWSCPLAPPGNVLDARVTAGELLQRAE